MERLRATWVENSIQTPWVSEKRLADEYRSRYARQFDLSVTRDLADSQTVVILGDGTYHDDELKRVLSTLPDRRTVLIHVYGSIVDQLSKFVRLEKYLRKQRVFFVSGSRAHWRVLASCLVDASQCAYSPYALSMDWREPPRRPGSKKVIAYWGRISWNKNVHHLIHLFRRFSRSRPDYVLRIAGPIDNLNWRQAPAGYYSNYAGEKFYESLLTAHAEGCPVEYVGQLSGNELEAFINSAHRFTSLSTCEEEDYGVAVTEALAHGLDVSCTRWGGFREFEHVPGLRLVPVSLQGESLVLDEEVLFESWESTAATSGEDRRRYFEALSPGAAIDLGKTNLFCGFHQNFLNTLLDTSEADFFNKRKHHVRSLWE